jgi:NADH:ubiquinone oxidoreductase subunit F (NADH-binding)
LWNYPTLVNNVETFYAVSLIDKGEYEGKRFYTVGGHCVFDGVFELHEDLSIADVLLASDNYPDFPFFVQVGGDLSGEVLNSSQLKRPVGGAGSITIHSFLKHDSLGLMRYWAKTYKQESCGQCTPCREGTYRLHEELKNDKPDWVRISQILNNLQETSFCGLGCSIKTPFATYVKNIMRNDNIDFEIDKKTRTCICEDFT